MKNYEINSEKEEKNKKRGLLITLFVHVAIVALTNLSIIRSMWNELYNLSLLWFKIGHFLEIKYTLS